MKIAVTGASGFIGRHLIPCLDSKGHEPILLSRPDLADPGPRLAGAEAIVHLAGLAAARGHHPDDHFGINRDLTLRVAAAARDAGMRRFVFVSSVHAETHRNTSYGASKAQAEAGLLALRSLEVVILRPVPVYGPASKGSFGWLRRLAALPAPLPLASATQKQSLVYVGNLVDALCFAALADDLAGRVFTVADPGEPPSIAKIVSLLRKARGRAPALFPFPVGRLRERIADGSGLTAAGWMPPFTTEEGLRQTALGE